VGPSEAPKTQGQPAIPRRRTAARHPPSPSGSILLAKRR
jgi:hypothetical protein